MLSFFRKKSTGSIDAPTVDGIIPKMEQLSANGAAPSTALNDDTLNASVAVDALDSSALVQSLGYGSLDELKETIFGEFRIR